MLQEIKYTTKELLEVLHITKDSWKKRRDEYLVWFFNFFNYEVTTDGRTIFYEIKEIYGEYEPMPRKKKSEEIKQYYSKETENIVKKEPWNTGSNIARDIIENNKNKYNHTEGTIANYVRPIIRNEYDITEKKWMRLMETYEPLTKEQEAYLQECFQTFYERNGKTSAELCADLECGLITKIEFAQYLADQTFSQYTKAMDTFKIKFGFRPIKVPKLEKKIMN